MKDEKKKTSEQTTGEKSDEALADEVLDAVAGGKPVIIKNIIHGDKKLGGIV